MNQEFNLLNHVGVVAKTVCAAAAETAAHEGDDYSPSGPTGRGVKKHLLPPYRTDDGETICIIVFTQFKLCLATATLNFKWVEWLNLHDLNQNIFCSLKISMFISPSHFYISAHFTSEQILHFGLAELNRCKISTKWVKLLLHYEFVTCTKSTCNHQKIVFAEHLANWAITLQSPVLMT